MIHPENLTRFLLTPYIMGRELARLRGDSRRSVVDSMGADGDAVVVVITMDDYAPARIECRAADLLMSLDDFSGKFLLPHA